MTWQTFAVWLIFGILVLIGLGMVGGS